MDLLRTTANIDRAQDYKMENLSGIAAEARLFATVVGRLSVGDYEHIKTPQEARVAFNEMCKLLDSINSEVQTLQSA